MFTELLLNDKKISPDRQQQHSRDFFPELVRKSKLNWWIKGTPFNLVGGRTLIGVATYSIEDLQLLDAINEMLTISISSDCLDVFNVLDCLDSVDFENYIPSIGKVFQTPAVGVWENGELKERGWGWEGKNILFNRYPQIVDRLIIS